MTNLKLATATAVGFYLLFEFLSYRIGLLSNLVPLRLDY